MYPDISRAGDVVWPRPNDDDLEQAPVPQCPHIQADDGSRGTPAHNELVGSRNRHKNWVAT